MDEKRRKEKKRKEKKREADTKEEDRTGTRLTRERAWDIGCPTWR